MMLNITNQILKKKLVEYLIVGLVVSFAWTFATFNGCNGCKDKKITETTIEFEKKDSLNQVTIDSLISLHTKDKEIIDSLMVVKKENTQSYSAFKENNKQKLNKKKHEIQNISGDSLYHDVIRDLSRLYTDD